MYIGNLVFLILVLISFIGLYKIFEKVGLPAWKALIPIYNFWIVGTIINRPKWWAFIMIVPGVNLIMYGVYGFHLARAFKKRMNNDLIIASFVPYLYFAYLGFDKNIKFFGVTDIKTESSFIKNWADPIIFAVVAASIIRGFFFEAFTIPTSSLEKSLMVGDFLFVNKICYGAKVPQTPIAFPFAHHTLPFTTETKSYLEWIKLPYMRLPGYSKPKNGEIIVFNYPDGDTITTGTQQYTSYYEMVRRFGYSNMNNPNFMVTLGDLSVKNGKKIGRPVDKREHYVKRCVGIAGDKLEIKDGEIFINDKKQEMPEHAQHLHKVKVLSSVLNIDEQFLDKFDIYVTEAYPVGANGDTANYILNMPRDVAGKLKNTPGIIEVERIIEPKGEYSSSIFPHNPKFPWNNDNFGPITLPKAGMTIQIDTNNLCIYEKMLSTYDDGIHQITTSGAQVLYDGKPITNYTFKQDYYWMMGDNRHNSADSRSWGVVPFDHIVGRPVFVWLSIKDPKNNPVSGTNIIGSLTKNSKEGKFRWERFMCYVGENGLVSWKIPVAIIALLGFGYNYWSKKRKPKENKTKK
jgi:signal peptidase I